MSEFRVIFVARDYDATVGGSPLAAPAGRNRDLTRYRTPIVGLYLTGAVTCSGPVSRRVRPLRRRLARSGAPEGPDAT